MTILKKLNWIEENAIIYNIHYCKAGIGIQYYESERLYDKAFQSLEDGLITYAYYDTFKDCVEAEYKRLKGIYEL